MTPDKLCLDGSEEGPSGRAHSGEKIILPPRLTQAARLDFRWLSGTDDNVESNAHPLTSPLCGWLIPSHQDCWVLVYDAAGGLLGYVDNDRKWQPAPGDPTAPSGPASIPNRHLGDVVGWMTSRRDDVMAPEGTDKLIAQLEAVTGTIEPEYAHGDSAHALFLGRPLAVARAFVGVSGKQSALLNDAFDTVKGLDDIALPVRLGDKSRSNDGLVGYFTPLTVEARGMSPAGNVGLRPPAQFSEITEDAPCLHLHLSGQAQRLTLLLDPRCPVHARCGLLPTKSIHMPVSHYAKSLSAIEMLLSVSPVLMEPEGTAVPHPHEPGRSTTWITRRDGTWQQTGHQPTIEKSAFLQAFNGLPTDGEMLWLALQTKGWIDTQPAGKARLLPAEQRQPLEGFASEEMALLLGRLSKVLRQPEHHATFGRRGVLQEGWLKLGLGKR